MARQTFGLLGHPVGHSVSPAMLTAAFHAREIDAEYVPFDVRPEDLREACAGLRLLPVAGLNVTVPHKDAIRDLLDEISTDARQIGAVNAVVVQGGKWIGENTDAPALERVLGAVAGAGSGEAAVILGAGGAARAALHALRRLGRTRIHVANRSPARAAGLAEEVASGVAVTSSGLDHRRLAEALSAADVLVQASSAGMVGIDVDDWPDIVPLEVMPPGAAVVDVIYAPRPTELLRRAQALGLRTEDGLAMLVEQGALAFERWTGTEAPRDVMRTAAEGRG